MDLVTLDEFKVYKNISTDDQDTRIIKIIRSVSSFVKEYCGTSFVDYFSNFKTEYFDGTITNVLYPIETPLLNPTSNVTLSASIDGGKTYEALILYTNYFFDLRYDAIVTGNAYNFLSNSYVGPSSLKLVYKGGYDEAPEDLKLAVMDLTEYFKEEEYTPKKVMSGATMDNAQFRLMYTTNLPPHIKRTLDLYRIIL